MNRKKIIIEDCLECPHLDYLTIPGLCLKLNSRLSPGEDLKYPIPDDCPLEDEEEKEGIQKMKNNENDSYKKEVQNINMRIDELFEEIFTLKNKLIESKKLHKLKKMKIMKAQKKTWRKR